MYIVLSLIAKSILAWLVLFGAMQPYNKSKDYSRILKHFELIKQQLWYHSCCFSFKYKDFFKYSISYLRLNFNKKPLISLESLYPNLY